MEPTLRDQIIKKQKMEVKKIKKIKKKHKYCIKVKKQKSDEF